MSVATTETTEESPAEEVARALAAAVRSKGNPDPHRLAQASFGRLSPAAREHLARRGWEQTIRLHLHVRRNGAPGREKVTPLKRAYYIENATSRWEHLAACTRADVRHIAEGYLRRSNENAVLAARFERLLAEMEAADVDKVADLGEEAVEQILDGET